MAPIVLSALIALLTPLAIMRRPANVHGGDAVLRLNKLRDIPIGPHSFSS